ncbi:MAG: TIGR04013 family B12-binding domain/radical SAM domain-containing protein [Candidatus Heimdallarchaeota archaeon]
MVQRICTVFRFRSTNWYSLPPLIFSLQQLERTLPKIEIRVEDQINERYASELIKDFDLVLILDSFQSPEARNILEEMNKRHEYPFSEIFYVAGGAHPSGDPLRTLKMGFDYVVVGEGEDTLKALLSTLNTSRNPISIPEGVARILNGDKIEFTPRKRRVNLDKCQPFATQPKSLHPPIEITRGCPFGCRFCQVSYLFGYRPRYRSVDIIEGIVKHYCQQFKERVQLRLITPNFLGYGSKTGRKPNIRALKKLIAAIKSYEVELFAGTFPSTVRPDFINEETTDLLDENVANRRISMGVQSGSSRVLANICRRGHSLNDVVKAHEILEAFGLKSAPDFIFGLPGEKTSDQWETLNLMRSLISQFDAKPRIHHFIPLPGTPLSNQPPSYIDTEIWNEICQLTSRELALGYFSNQIRIAKEILNPLEEPT